MLSLRKGHLGGVFSPANSNHWQAARKTGTEQEILTVLREEFFPVIFDGRGIQTEF
jgi:hypothetical protein